MEYSENLKTQFGFGKATLIFSKNEERNNASLILEYFEGTKDIDEFMVVKTIKHSNMFDYN